MIISKNIIWMKWTVVNSSWKIKWNNSLVHECEACKVNITCSHGEFFFKCERRREKMYKNREDVQQESGILNIQFERMASTKILLKICFVVGFFATIVSNYCYWNESSFEFAYLIVKVIWLGWTALIWYRFMVTISKILPKSSKNNWKRWHERMNQLPMNFCHWKMVISNRVHMALYSKVTKILIRMK